MKKHKVKPFLYRIALTDKNKKDKTYLAEVVADCDENARRKIVHITLAEKGNVHSIIPTDDRSRYTGELPMRTYNN